MNLPLRIAKFIISIPGLYCRILADEYQRSADFLLGHHAFDKQSFGYRRGEVAQATADIFDAMAVSLGVGKE